MITHIRINECPMYVTYLTHRHTRDMLGIEALRCHKGATEAIDFAKRR